MGIFPSYLRFFSLNSQIATTGFYLLIQQGAMLCFLWHSLYLDASTREDIEVCEADYKKCQQWGTCSLCSCKDTDDFCCDLGTCLSWADFIQRLKQGLNKMLQTTLLRKKEEQIMSKIRKDKGEKYFLSSCECWLKELIAKAWLVKKYSNMFWQSLLQAFEYRQSKKLLSIWQLDSMYQITKLLQTIWGLLPVALLTRTVKQDPAQKLSPKLVVCLALFLIRWIFCWNLLKLWFREAAISLETGTPTVILPSCPLFFPLWGWVKSAKVILRNHIVGCGLCIPLTWAIELSMRWMGRGGGHL